MAPSGREMFGLRKRQTRGGVCGTFSSGTCRPAHALTNVRRCCPLQKGSATGSLGLGFEALRSGISTSCELPQITGTVAEEAPVTLGGGFGWRRLNGAGRAERLNFIVALPEASHGAMRLLSAMAMIDRAWPQTDALFVAGRREEEEEEERGGGGPAAFSTAADGRAQHREHRGPLGRRSKMRSRNRFAYCCI
jgi:hypothetical protein